MPGRNPLQPSTIARPALEGRLDAALDRRLTCVVAGPGFGKTTLLSRWAETTPQAMSAWHGLTEGDRTLSAVVRAVTDALRLCVPGLPPDLVHRGERAPRARHRHRRVRAGPGLRRPHLRGRGRGGARARSSWCSTTSRCSTGRPSRPRSSPRLCRQASPPLHVVVASRGDIPFPVARLRGQGLLAELSAADLAFTGPTRPPRCSRCALGRRRRRDADAAWLAAELHAITAGWPAAVRLAGEALARDRARPTGGARPRPAAPARRRRPRLPGRRGGRRRARARPRPAGAPRGPRPLHPRAGRRRSGPGDPAALAGLVRRGLVVDAPGRGRWWLRVNALLREVIAASARRPRRAAHADARGARPAGSASTTNRAAARALLAARPAPAPTPAGSSRRWGPALLRPARPTSCSTPRPRARGRPVARCSHRLEGDARQLVGDWDAAVACLRAGGRRPRRPPRAGPGVALGAHPPPAGRPRHGPRRLRPRRLDEDTATDGPADNVLAPDPVDPNIVYVEGSYGYDQSPGRAGSTAAPTAAPPGRASAGPAPGLPRLRVRPERPQAHRDRQRRRRLAVAQPGRPAAPAVAHATDWENLNGTVDPATAPGALDRA